MAALTRISYDAEVIRLGMVPQDIAEDRINAQPRERIEFEFAGAPGTHHHGETRKSCSRVKMLYAPGTEIRNTRQLSILTQEELDAIAAGLGLEALNPAWLGASMVLRGIPDFSHVPRPLDCKHHQV
jgi:hypothetical protein